jgi:hypothetical protein
MNAFGLSKVSGDALKELYGSFGDTVLYWAHHEKLCVVDRKVVFMGGLDMCTAISSVSYSLSRGIDKLILRQALEDTIQAVSR